MPLRLFIMLVREIKRTLRNTKVMLDKPQDAPEVVAKGCQCIPGECKPRLPPTVREAVLVITLALLRHRQ